MARRRRRYDHYHTILGTPGYLSDTNELFDTRREAEDYAQSLADDERESNAQRDDVDDRTRVTGNKRDGYVVSWGEWGSGYQITIEPCDDLQCREELGDDN